MVLFFWLLFPGWCEDAAKKEKEEIMIEEYEQLQCKYCGSTYQGRQIVYLKTEDYEQWQKLESLDHKQWQKQFRWQLLTCFLVMIVLFSTITWYFWTHTPWWIRALTYEDYTFLEHLLALSILLAIMAGMFLVFVFG